MPQESLLAKTRRRFNGLLLLALIAGLITLSIAIYNKAFTATTDITIAFDHTGNELQKDSDVKERGIIVGSVTSIDSDGNGALVHIALEPSRVKDIPNNVTAQILPKTLFGEQYVSLNIPNGEFDSDHLSVPAIKAGARISQDRTQGALETEKVLADIYPLLTAVQPAQLNSTLTALADALHNRGAELGQTLQTLDSYLKQINPHTAQLVDDLAKLGKVAVEYNGAAPDLLATLQNLQTSVRTVIAKQAGLQSLLTTGSDTAQVLQGFLADNQQRLIDVTGQTNKVYALLNEYSPEFSCLFSGVNKLANSANTIIYNGQIHLSITVDNQNLGPYKPGEEPKLVTGYGPNCFGLPNPEVPFQIPAKYKCLNDGAALTKAGESPGCSTTSSGYEDKALNSPEEDSYIDALIAPAMKTTPNKVSGAATLLAGPLLRGQRVVIK